MYNFRETNITVAGPAVVASSADVNPSISATTVTFGTPNYVSPQKGEPESGTSVSLNSPTVHRYVKTAAPGDPQPEAPEHQAKETLRFPVQDLIDFLKEK